METSELSSASLRGNGGNIEKVTAAALDAIDKAVDVVGNKVAASAHRGVDSVAGVAKPAAAWFDLTADRVKQKQQKILEEGSEYVRAKPLTTLVTVLAIGFLLGRLMR